MKRHWIEYRDTSPVGPMTFWVHREVGEKPWAEADEFDPPRQSAIPGRGYPLFRVEFDGFVFEFASLAELSVCIDTLGQKLMPRALELSRQRGAGAGPNSHWVSRLPAEVSSWRYREKTVAYLRKALADFERETAG